MPITPRAPTEDERRRMLAEAVEQVEARDLAHRNAEARRIGPIALATVGVEAWSRFGDDPRGGVIVEIVDGGFDADTGEVIPRRFRTLNPYGAGPPREVLLPEHEVTEGSFTVPDTSRLVKMARRLAAEVAKGGNLATPRDERYARWERELIVVAMGGGR